MEKDRLKNKLPEVNLPSNLGVRIIDRALSTTFLLIIALIVVGLILINFIKMKQNIEATGVLEPSAIIKIYAPESGVIREVNFTGGTQVNKNDFLISYDISKLYEQLDGMRYELNNLSIQNNKLKFKESFDREEIDANIEQAKINYNKARILFKEAAIDFYPGKNADSIISNYKYGFSTSLDKAYIEMKLAENNIKTKQNQIKSIDNVKFEIESNKNSIEKLVSQINYLEKKITGLKIFSPQSGIILSENNEQLKGKTVNEGEILLEISNLNKWKIILFLPEMEVYKTKIDDKVQVEFSALKLEEDNELFPAFIKSISADKIVKDNNINNVYKVIAELDEKKIPVTVKNKLKKGYTVKATIILKDETIAQYGFRKIKELTGI